ncbi:predicted protein [Naegleria gruberi]|uniref:Predicted protein n=1 Tax=Naegleria gruberi TaxID=5762 RepID=D2VZ53_NAEGR|nr:uncharacterized protein NAEGRDRAFT_74363 [Naegleria gruberi]EFC37932.1 predicted protein [Naegleria gruberi]|eukprot:XP_002670676.1 predicted protein [Naegleria gruberi strain NEG-M]
MKYTLPTDFNNHKIRKILKNGNIITIAGNGKRGHGGDSTFDISKNPHIGGFKYPQKLEIKLKKHSRDLLFKTSIYAFIPLIEILSPLFSKLILKNEPLISSLNSTQQQIIQNLIDSQLYNEIKLKFNDDEILNVLFILGLFQNNEFIELKKLCVFQFIQSLTIQNLSKKWEEIELYLSQCTNELHLKNYILEYLHNYCVEFAAIQTKTEEGSKYLPTLPIMTRYCVNIFSKIVLSQPNPIILNEIIEIEPLKINQLYNDKKTSDLKIQMDENNYLYCHKTILSSTSSLFNAMFDCGSTFADLNKSEKIISLLDMAMKYEVKYLVIYCKNNFRITIDNYFDIVSICENYIDLEFFESFFKELLKFGIQNRKKLFYDSETVSRLPPKLCQAMVI